MQLAKKLQIGRVDRILSSRRVPAERTQAFREPVRALNYTWRRCLTGTRRESPICLPFVFHLFAKGVLWTETEPRENMTDHRFEFTAETPKKKAKQKNPKGNVHNVLYLYFFYEVARELYSQIKTKKKNPIRFTAVRLNLSVPANKH